VIQAVKLAVGAIAIVVAIAWFFGAFERWER